MTNRVELETMVEEVIAAQSTAEWEALLGKGRRTGILDVAQALEHPQTQERGMFPAIEVVDGQDAHGGTAFAARGRADRYGSRAG